jgi:hypothetical protein
VLHTKAAASFALMTFAALCDGIAKDTDGLRGISSGNLRTSGRVQGVGSIVTRRNAHAGYFDPHDQTENRRR